MRISSLIGFILLFLVTTCTCTCSPPPFELEYCQTECMKCPDLDCDAICGALKAGIESEICQTVSEDVWYCAIENGCYFPMTCEAEIHTFLTCGP